MRGFYPVNSLRVEPIRPGPYRFETEEEANAFVEETGRALESSQVRCFVESLTTFYEV